MASILSLPQCVNWVCLGLEVCWKTSAWKTKVHFIMCANSIGWDTAPLCQNGYGWLTYRWVNKLRLRQNGRYFADDTFKGIFLNEKVRILIKISLKFVPKGPIINIPALVQIMAWHRPSNFKVRGEKKLLILTRVECFWTVTPVWIHWWILNDAQSLVYYRKGALLFSKVIHQISRGEGTKNLQFWPELSVSRL